MKKEVEWMVGTDLHSEDQAKVLARFVHRYTKEHRPKWLDRTDRPDLYPVQFASDHDWLARTYFAVKRNGRLDERVTVCRAMPTWPDNPELRPPLAVSTDG